MEIRDGFLGSIGNTPLIRLRGPSELTGCEILGKAEFLNPGGSVKDRAARYILLAAANRDGHIASTGPEIWAQTGGKVDGFTCAIGTGGTLSGVSMFLKKKNPRIKIAVADPVGAAMYSWFKHGELKSDGSSITEGIGQ